jgi:hypothetical protein
MENVMRLAVSTSDLVVSERQVKALKGGAQHCMGRRKAVEMS